jgi:hypothetical protein
VPDSLWPSMLLRSYQRARRAIAPRDLFVTKLSKRPSLPDSVRDFGVMHHLIASELSAHYDVEHQ